MNSKNGVERFGQKGISCLLSKKIWADFLYSRVFETPNESIKYLKQLQEFDDQSPTIDYNIGFLYDQLYQYDKAIPGLERAVRYMKNGI